ncbi:hypothetical protein Hanom_Chr11g01047191 [Helianthus anomalus]
MFRQLTRQHQPHSSLNLPRRNRRLLIIPRKPRTLLSKLLKNIINKTVHNPHRLARYPDIRMHLLQHLKYVYLVCLHTLLAPLLLLVGRSRPGFLWELLSGFRLLLGWGFFGCWLLLGWLLFCCLWRHFLNF